MNESSCEPTTAKISEVFCLFLSLFGKNFLSAPTNNISNVRHKESGDPNPILPNSKRTYTFTHFQDFQNVNGRMGLISTTWYVKFTFSYSDESTGGHPYSEPYYMKLDYNIPNGIQYMNQQEADAFETAIRGE